MKSRAKKFLTLEEQSKVTAAVQEMEKRTSGEIVPMIVAESDDYPTASIKAGVLIALPLAILVTHILGGLFWVGPQNMWLFIGLFAVLYVLVYFASRFIDALRIPFLPGKRVAREVAENALASFYTEGLFRTKEANGILLFISVLEQRVTILADQGINEKLDQSTWDAIVDELTAAIKDGRRCEGICTAVNQIGEILEKHFRYLKDDEDELHNLIIR